MIGGPPIPQFASQPQFVPQPRSNPAPSRQYVQQGQPAIPWPPQPAPQFAPIARAKVDDPLPPLKLPAFEDAAPLALPPPEALGVGVPVAQTPATTLDWNSVRARLDSLRADGIQLTRLGDGRCRFAFLVPTGVDAFHNVEAIALSEAEAVLAALARVEQTR